MQHEIKNLIYMCMDKNNTNSRPEKLGKHLGRNDFSLVRIL